ncbi:hypothetical protein LOZ80_19630 [Paenibacillus sp. HWE-109]|uniref:hypothetical protein n=1 Tax=Paenibacillus sp. HWE-109 TaxID=1306526 RepID=UPI001EDCA584|nr:hypothetical protein [Paenibacillus sp. HWE-109]UKS23857.1 hypothetical protein LOZ80_19630 [Paenibacillus sp. HWE-109]
MRLKLSLLFAFLISSTLFVGIVSADWANMFVVNDGKIYVISEEHIDPKQIGLKIGKVTKYSDREGTYSGNFSNYYPKGTGYYEIMGLGINEAIAIKDDKGLYIKATYGGEYAGNRYNAIDFLPYVFAVLLVFISGYFIKKKINR